MTASGSTSSDPFLPPRWFIRLAWRIHRALYRITGGRKGLRRPRPGRYGMMRVTTIGRTTGQERAVILAYLEEEQNVVTLAMNGWGAPDPQWWQNLQAHPEVTIELPDRTMTATGRAAPGHERDRLWQRWQELDEKLDRYAAKRPTETAVVVFEPVA